MERIITAIKLLERATNTTTLNKEQDISVAFAITFTSIIKIIKQLFYTIFEDYNKEYIASTYNKIEHETGRKFKASDLSAAKPGGDTFYEWKGKFPPKNRFWAYSKDNMQNFEKEGRLYYSSTGKPYLKHYLEEMPGVSIDDLWTNCNFRSKLKESVIRHKSPKH